ncbi:MAG: hypothetical protein K6G15_03950 [Desulfovibrio sp.]|nr:hypothetical protein [Desulfovibrio sp.]
MSATRLLLSCVNSRVSLIGFDLDLGKPFWYCPANQLRACGICYEGSALWVASDSSLTCVTAQGMRSVALPGPQANYVHSIKSAGHGLLGVADTGNSRLLLFDGTHFPLSYSPLEGFGANLPLDAVHLNDFLPVEDGFLVSTFSHQPFSRWKQTSFAWQKEGLGCLFHLKPVLGQTSARIAAAGLNCPHSLQAYAGAIYCCSSSEGDFLRLERQGDQLWQVSMRLHVTDTHFLRGALRLEDGWMLGGSSPRHLKQGGGMQLYRLYDDGRSQTFQVGGPGEIYDILFWQDFLPDLCDVLFDAPEQPSDGCDPPRCRLPGEYR